jgi:predicted Fe-Mo cluster-binding NifX family protein
MIVCVPVSADGQIGPSWGRADRVAIADVGDAGVGRWEVLDVGWDQTHDLAGEGEHDTHHARIARFLTDNGVACVVVGHMGPPMQQMLGQMGIRVVLGASGDARSAVAAVRAD